MCSLTPDMIFAKTKSRELNSIRKLNCWASNLTDITILNELTNIEILNLSVNKISSLKDLKNCKNLAELYVRNNKISELDELFYLKSLPNLRVLWLADNKCAHNDNYRLTVLRNLPNLVSLDKSDVTEQELEDALKWGRLIEQAPEYEPQIELDESSSNIVEDELLDMSQISVAANSIDENILPKLNQKEELYEDEANKYKREDSITEKKLESNLDELQRVEENELTDSNLRSSDESKQGNQESMTQELISAQNSNVLIALLYLIKDLDQTELDILISECQKRKETLNLFEE